VAAKKKHKLVIDADVARSASERQHPDSSNCRKVLESVRDNKHFLVMTHEIRKEWDRHQSAYTAIWLASMKARKQIAPVNIDEKDRIESKLSDFGLTDKQEKIALKDCHLIDAALKTDKIIASADDTARTVFSIACIKADRLKTLIWVNPKTMAAELIVWLEGKRKIRRALTSDLKFITLKIQR